MGGGKNNTRGPPSTASKPQGQKAHHRCPGTYSGSKQNTKLSRENKTMGHGGGEEEVAMHAIVIVGEREVELSFLPTTRHLPAVWMFNFLASGDFRSDLIFKL